MGLRDDEQRVLDAIEYELLSGDPQLWDCFSALGSTTLPVQPVKARSRTAPDKRQARRGRHRRTNNQVSATVELVLVLLVVMLVLMVIFGIVWMPATLGH